MISEQNFRRLLNVIPHNQTFYSPIQGLTIHHSDHPFEYENMIQEPSICIVLKGEREIRLGEQCYAFNNEHFMFCPVNVPMSGTIHHATKAEPFVVVSMKLDLQTVQKILLEHAALFAKKSENPTAYFGKWQLDEVLEQAFERLLLLHETPSDIIFLAPLIQQEIYYRLLTGEQGDKLKSMVSFGSHTQKIAQATQWIQAHFAKPFTVDELAAQCGMSVSGFHHHFKKMTTLSPLQYQKALRLAQARTLIRQGNPIAQAAFAVGYESPSQFSREYSRHFGCPPSGDMKVDM